jgi:hypothetical protein
MTAQSPVSRQLVSMATDIGSAKDTDHFFQSSAIDISTGGKLRKIFTLADLSPADAETYSAFIACLGKHQPPNLLLLAQFDAQTHSSEWITSPSLGLNGEGLPVLRYGVSHGDDKEVEFPLEFITESENVPEAFYRVGCKSKIKLSLIFGQRQDQTRYPVFELKAKSRVFRLSAKLVKDTTFDEAEYAYISGQLETVLKSFLSEGVKMTNFLQPVFENGEFPKGGIFLVLANGEYKEFEWDSVIKSSSWKILETSHPDLLVKNWGSKGKEKIIELGEATTLTQSWDSQQSKASRAMQTVGGSIPLLFMHIYAPERSNKFHWTPQHSVFRSVASIPQAVQALFRDLINEYSNTAIAGSQKPTALPPVEVPFSMDDVALEKMVLENDDDF